MDQVEDKILILIKSDEIIPILHLTSNQDRLSFPIYQSGSHEEGLFTIY